MHISVIVGQAVLELKGTTVWAKGGVFDLPLQGQRVAPKEKNKTAMRLGGAVYIHIYVCRVSSSHALCQKANNYFSVW